MNDCTESDIASVATTLGSLDDAKALAREILERRLGACVQIEPRLTSIYRWKGKLCEDPEVRLVIKTLPGCVDALAALFTSHHPYELPQFLVSRHSAGQAYGDWVRSEVSLPSASLPPA